MLCNDHQALAACFLPTASLVALYRAAPALRPELLRRVELQARVLQRCAAMNDMLITGCRPVRADSRARSMSKLRLHLLLLERVII